MSVTGQVARRPLYTSIGQNPFTETIYFCKYSPFTRGFWAKMPVYESCAAGLILGSLGQFGAILGFSGLFLHKYAVYTGPLALKFSFTVTIPCKRVLSDTRIYSMENAHMHIPPPDLRRLAIKTFRARAVQVDSQVSGHLASWPPPGNSVGLSTALERLS